MTQEITTLTASDPEVINWSEIVLPKTFPDLVSNPRELIELLSRVFGKRKRVVLPEGMPGKDLIPKYILQEFHNIPNGNYSENLSSGYIKGFDISMLGEAAAARREIASHFTGMESALDVGCAGGKMGAALADAGVKDVWGLDPSPYLLKHASRSFPNIKFVQGIAELTGFSAARFNGISACFVFHEIPPKAASQALTEFHRILKPGGIVAISEPSEIQMRESKLNLFKRWGFKGIYFWFVAHWMHEPFVKAWHKQDIPSWLNQHGFELVSDNDSVPIRKIIARKVEK